MHVFTRPGTRVRAIALAAALGFAVSGCSSTETGAEGSTLDRVREEGTITVGFAAEEPYGFRDGGELTGEAPVLHGEIFDRMGGIEVEGKQYDFNSLIPALNAGEIDVVSAGMFINAERCEQAAFSDPEYVAQTALMVPKGNPKGLTDFASVAKSKARLAVMRGAVEQGQAEAAGVSDFEVVADQPSGLDALTSGRADAFALTDISLNWLAKGNDDVEVTDSFVPVVDGEEQIGVGAAVFRQEDTELRDAFNQELDAVLEDGDAWLDAVGEFGFTEANKPEPNMSASEFCQG